MSERELRVAVVGCGFWATYQATAWGEVAGARVVAVCDRDLGKAEGLAARLGRGATAYSDAAAMIDRERPNVLDVITNVETHPQFVHLAADRKTPVICQKPLAATMAEAEAMIAACAWAGVPLFVHENWRWQRPIRELKRVLAGGAIGRVFRARVDMVSGFPVFKNQPALAELEQFILTDLGVHLLDAARFLFGEAASLYCQTHKVHANTRGEDVATVMLRMNGAGGDTTVTCNMGYAENFLEHDRFPETYVFVEGDRGSVELGPDYWIRVTTADGTHARRYPPPRYAWADPAYDVVQASLVDANRDFARALRGEAQAETTGADNLKTLRLVFAAYDSAAVDKVVLLGSNAEAQR